MKQGAILLISFYQILCSPLLKALLGTERMCRYPLSCSEYAKEAILRYGVIKGGQLAIRRLLSCQPFRLVNSKHEIRSSKQMQMTKIQTTKTF